MLDVLTLGQEKSARKIIQVQTKMQGELEDVAAMQRETDRKMALSKAIGTIRASAAAGGIDSNTGSPLSIVSETIKESERDSDRDAFNTRMRKMSGKFRSSMQRGEMRAASVTSFLESMESKAQSAATAGATGGTVK